MPRSPTKLLFDAGLALNATLTRRPVLRRVEEHLFTPFFVWLTRRIRGAPPAPVESTPAALGREWERLLRRGARVTSIDEATGTAYGEITVRCPLRGTGDVAACHRLMAYDRGLMAHHGASFVVLASQAAGGTSCRIAIRAANLSTADLVPAHRLVRAVDRNP